MPADVSHYRLRVEFPGDHVLEFDDPYRYGRVLTDFDLHLLGEGTHYRAFDKLGAHRIAVGSTIGVHFAVWAPNADRVSVIGDFNGWDGRVHAMRLLTPSGVWEIFIPDLPDGEAYKFEIRTATGDLLQEERSVRLRVRGAARIRPRSFTTPRTMPGATTSGWRRGEATAPGSTSRCRFTRCISDRGRASRKRATGS